jgi:aquaporin Z
VRNTIGIKSGMHRGHLTFWGQEMQQRLAVEFFGTFWLVLGGCGSAVLAAAYPKLGIGFAGVALAFGLTVLTMAYAVGDISGAHFNPAVTVDCSREDAFPGKTSFLTRLHR